MEREGRKIGRASGNEGHQGNSTYQIKQDQYVHELTETVAAQAICKPHGPALREREVDVSSHS